MRLSQLNQVEYEDILLIVKYLAHSGSSFFSIKSPALLDIAHRFLPNTPMPDHRQIKKLFERLYEEHKATLMERLKKVEAVALTTDGWSTRRTKRFVVITTHWVKDGVFYKAVLDFKFFPRKHTAVALAEHIFDVELEFGIANKVLTVTTDNAKNATKSILILQKLHHTNLGTPQTLKLPWHIGCMAHTINIVVREGLDELKLVRKLRDILGVLRGVCSLNELFEETTRSLLGKRKRVPGLDVETRWNSMYLMIKSSIKLREVIDVISATDLYKEYIKDLYLNKDDWASLEKVTELLKVAYDYTNELSASSYVSLGQAVPIYQALKSQFKKSKAESQGDDSVSVQINKASELMLEKLKKYKENFKNDLTILAWLLDPNNDHIAPKAITYKNHLRENARIFSLSLNGTELTSEFEGAKITQCDEMNDGEIRDPVDFLYSRIGAGMDLKRDEKMKFYRNLSDNFGVLSEMAFRILLPMATSVPSESVFSIARNILGYNRGRLNETTIEMIVKLKCLLDLYYTERPC